MNTTSRHIGLPLADRGRILTLVPVVILFIGLTGFLSFQATFALGQSITLDEAVQTALQNNPDLQKQVLGQDLAQENMSGLKSQNYGRFNLVSTYNHYNLPRTLAPITPASLGDDPWNIATTQDLFTAGVIYEVELFTGMTRKRSIEISALESEMAGASLRLGREQLIYNVRTIYLNILSLQAQEKAQSAYGEALQRLYDDITRELELGRKAKIDQLKAAADLKNAQAGLERITANISIMKSSLANLMGVEQVPDLQDIELTPETMVPVQEDFSGQTTGLQRLKGADLAVQKNQKLVQKTSGSLYPQIVLTGAYGSNFGPNDSSNINSGDWKDETVWQAGLSFKWTFFDFGSRGSQVQKARILEQQSIRDKTKTELQLRHSLAEAATKINAALMDYDSARMELDMTRETEAIENIRFEKGAADINDLLYAKARNLMAESHFISAGYEYRIAEFYLDYLLENGENQ